MRSAVHITPRTIFALLLLVLAWALFSFTAQAAAINEKGAEKLRLMFERELAEQAKVYSGPETLKIDGETLVEPSDGYYAVTLPYLSLINDDGSVFEIGIIAINAKPAAQEKLWKMSIAMPTPLTLYGPDGTAKMTVSLGEQNAAGLWHEDHGVFIDLAARYGNLMIKSASGKASLTIPEIIVKTNFTKNENDHWSGPSTITAKDIALDVSGKIAATLKNFNAQIDMADYDLGMARQIRNELIPSSTTEGDKAEDTNSEKPDFAAMLTTLLDGFHIQTDFSGLHITLDPEGMDEQQHKLESGRFGYGINGLRGETMALDLGIALNKIESEPAVQDWNPAYPHSFDIGISADSIPHKGLIDMADSNLTKDLLSETAKQNMQLLALQAMIKLPVLLTNAGTVMRLDRLNFENETYKASANAILRAQGDASLFFTGNGKAHIENLPALRKAVAVKIGEESTTAEQSVKLTSLLNLLKVLESVGTEKTPAAEKPVHEYNLEINKDGQTLLNGEDIRALTPDTP